MISVCIATYNGASYIEQQLESILPQLAESDEVVVVDDNSTDDTVGIITGLGDSRIRVIPATEQHTSSSRLTKLEVCNIISHNFAKALQLCKGDYIFFADQDDCWMPNKVSTMMRYLESHDLVISDCKVVDANLNTISESYLSDERLKHSPWPYIVRNRYLGCTMAFRRRIIERALPWPYEPVMHDLWILLTALRNGKCIQIQDKCILYRRHDGNASSSSSKSDTTLSFKIKYRYLVLKAFLRACFRR